METKPQISVIVPVYKVEPYLQKCIDSILAQTFRDIEVILVDDGSPDNCPAICDAAAEKDERVRVIHQKNGGLSAARNAGLDIARGEWIGFVDSDDYIAPEMYQTLYNTAIKNDAQLALCSYAYVDIQGGVLCDRRSPIQKEEILDRMQAVDRLGGDRGWYYVTAWNRLYRRELFENIRFPNGKCHEDEYTAHHIFWACERIAVVPEQLYFYVQRNDGIMYNVTLQRCLDNIWGLFDRIDFAQEHGLDRLMLRSCNGVLGLLIKIRTGDVRIDDKERELYKRENARINEKLWKMLWTPRCAKYKAGILIYMVSPRLCGLMMRLKRKMMTQRKKKAGSQE